jgi:hypothetical protein
MNGRSVSKNEAYPAILWDHSNFKGSGKSIQKVTLFGYCQECKY